MKRGSWDIDVYKRQDVSNSIAVYYNNQTKTVDRETYIYTVLSSELYGKSYYTGKGPVSYTHLLTRTIVFPGTFPFWFFCGTFW